MDERIIIILTKPIPCVAVLSCLLSIGNVSIAADVYYPPVSESLERLSSSNQYVRDRGMRELVGMGKAAAPANDILSAVALSSNSLPRTRSSAAEAMRNIDEGRAAAQFIQELTNASPTVREYAVDALMTVRRSDAAIPLFYRLRDENEQVRSRAGIALQFYKDDHLATLLLATLQNREDRARQWAPWLLGRMGRQDAAIPLTKLLDDPAPAFRKSVIAALRDLKSRDAVPSLIVVVTQDKDDDVRAGAIRCLGELGDASAGRVLLGVLSDPNPDIRASAAGGLGMLKIEEAKEPLRKMFGSVDYRDKLAAMGGLCLLGDQQTVPLIISSLDGQPPELLSYFMWGLVELNAIAEITSLQTHKSEAVRTAAQKALERVEKRKSKSSNNGAESAWFPASKK